MLGLASSPTTTTLTEMHCPMQLLKQINGISYEILSSSVIVNVTTNGKQRSTSKTRIKICKIRDKMSQYYTVEESQSVKQN